jgi:hypothetical protein
MPAESATGALPAWEVKGLDFGHLGRHLNGSGDLHSSLLSLLTIM